MYFIDEPNAVASPPRRLLLRPRAISRGGNPALAQAATKVRAWWLNMVQGELAGLLVTALITRSKNDVSQVTRAVQVIARGRELRFGGSGTTTWSVPDGVYEVELYARGAGGPGGGTAACTSSQVSVAPGGNAGTRCRGVFVVQPGDVITLTRGAGGAGNVSTGGTRGGSTVVTRTRLGVATTLLVAPGGAPGVNAPAAVPFFVQAATAPSLTVVAVGGLVQSYEVSGGDASAGSVLNTLSGRGGDAGEDGTGGGSVGGGGSFNGNTGLGYGSAARAPRPARATPARRAALAPTAWLG